MKSCRSSLRSTIARSLARRPTHYAAALLSRHSFGTKLRKQETEANTWNDSVPLLLEVLMRGCNPNFPKETQKDQDGGHHLEAMPQLNKWLEQQRHLHSKNKLSPYGQYLLEKMGVDLDWQPLPPRDRMWRYITNVDNAGLSVQGGKSLDRSENDSSVPYGWYNPEHYWRDPVWVHWMHSMPPVLKQIRFCGDRKFRGEREAAGLYPKGLKPHTQEGEEGEGGEEPERKPGGARKMKRQKFKNGESYGDAELEYYFPVDLEEYAETLNEQSFRPYQWAKHIKDSRRATPTEEKRSGGHPDKRIAMMKRALQYEKIKPFQLTLAELRLLCYRGLRLEAMPNSNYQTFIARLKTWLEHWKTTEEGKKVAKELVREVRASPLRCILLDGLHRLGKERTCLQAQLAEKETASGELRSLKHDWMKNRRKLERDQELLNQALLVKSPEEFCGDEETDMLEEKFEILRSEEYRADAWVKVLKFRHARIDRQLEMDYNDLSSSTHGERWALVKQRLAAMEQGKQGGKEREDNIKKAKKELETLEAKWKSVFEISLGKLKGSKAEVLLKSTEERDSSECKRLRALKKLDNKQAFEVEKQRFVHTEVVSTWNELIDMIYEERSVLAREIRDLKMDGDRVKELIEHTAARNKFIAYSGGKEEAVSWEQWAPSEVHDTEHLGATEFRVGLSKHFGDRDTHLVEEPWNAVSIMHSTPAWQSFELDPRVQWRRSYEFSAPAWYTETKNYHYPTKERVESCDPQRPDPNQPDFLINTWAPGEGSAFRTQTDLASPLYDNFREKASIDAVGKLVAEYESRRQGRAAVKEQALKSE